MTATFTGGITFAGGITFSLAPPPPPPSAGWYAGGGSTAPISSALSTISRITFATDTATASVRGPLSSARRNLAASGNETDGWFGGGYNVVSTVDRITYATDTTTASIRGPLSVSVFNESGTSGIQ